MSISAIKVCVDIALPDELLLESMRRAIEENPNNAPAINPRSLPLGVMPDLTSIHLAAITGKLWQPGRVLRVRFLDGDPRVHERIPPFAHQWSQHANITFDFGDDPDAEIRISFQNQGSWSYIGTDALAIPTSQPTMNFGWLTPATTNDEYQRVVTHEFGHALGCIHEHQNPDGDIPWDREKVYRFYQGAPNFWTREQVDVNLFTRYEADITQFSAFDPESIMLYPIPNEFTVGDFEIGWNKTMSAIDKQFINTLYPANRSASSVLTIGAPPSDAVIGEFGEIDVFNFTVNERATYRIETTGSTDVVMSLFGPNSPTRSLAMDDDSGIDRNARIIINLRPGDYTVRVRHFSPYSTGGYRILIRKEEALPGTGKEITPPEPKAKATKPATKSTTRKAASKPAADAETEPAAKRTRKPKASATTPTKTPTEPQPEVATDAIIEATETVATEVSAEAEETKALPARTKAKRTSTKKPSTKRASKKETEQSSPDSTDTNQIGENPAES